MTQQQHSKESDVHAIDRLGLRTSGSLRGLVMKMNPPSRSVDHQWSLPCCRGVFGGPDRPRNPRRSLFSRLKEPRRHVFECIPGCGSRHILRGQPSARPPGGMPYEPPRRSREDSLLRLAGQDLVTITGLSGCCSKADWRSSSPQNSWYVWQGPEGLIQDGVHHYGRLEVPGRLGLPGSRQALLSEQDHQCKVCAAPSPQPRASWTTSFLHQSFAAQAQNLQVEYSHATTLESRFSRPFSLSCPFMLKSVKISSHAKPQVCLRSYVLLAQAVCSRCCAHTCNSSTQ